MCEVDLFSNAGMVLATSFSKKSLNLKMFYKDFQGSSRFSEKVYVGAVQGGLPQANAIRNKCRQS